MILTASRPARQTRSGTPRGASRAQHGKWKVAADVTERLLDVAEWLFVERGLARTSVREIAAAAQAHPTSINYHFGSKEGLVHAVIARRVDALTQKRGDLLTAFETNAGDAPVPVESILPAFVAPGIRHCLEHSQFHARRGATGLRAEHRVARGLRRARRRSRPPLRRRTDARLSRPAGDRADLAHALRHRRHDPHLDHITRTSRASRAAWSRSAGSRPSSIASSPSALQACAAARRRVSMRLGAPHRRHPDRRHLGTHGRARRAHTQGDALCHRGS